jgi:hypothetical protein
MMRYQARGKYSLTFILFWVAWLVALLYILVQLLIFAFKLIAAGVIVSTGILVITAVPLGIMLLVSWGYRSMRQKQYSCVYSLLLMLSCGMSGFSLSYLKFATTYSVLIPLICVFSSITFLVMLSYSPVTFMKRKWRQKHLKGKLICP